MNRLLEVTGGDCLISQEPACKCIYMYVYIITVYFFCAKHEGFIVDHVFFLHCPKQLI